MSAPERGEVWLVDLGMAAKVRPALVLSMPATDVDRALVTLVPHTTSPRIAPVGERRDHESPRLSGHPLSADHLGLVQCLRIQSVSSSSETRLSASASISVTTSASVALSS